MMKRGRWPLQARQNAAAAAAARPPTPPIAWIGGVRDHLPAVLSGVGIRLTHRVVIVAGNPDDLGPISRDRRLAAGTDIAVQVDLAGTTELLGTPGDGFSMIAIGGGGHGDLANDFVEFSSAKLGAGYPGIAASCLDQGSQKLVDRVGAAQSLERAEAKSRPLILQPESANAKLARYPIESVQRGRRIALPELDFHPRPNALGLGHDLLDNRWRRLVDQAGGGIHIPAGTAGLKRIKPEGGHGHSLIRAVGPVDLSSNMAIGSSDPDRVPKPEPQNRVGARLIDRNFD